MSGTTPRALGYRLPAEWEPQEAIWFSWPTSPHIWPSLQGEVSAKFAEIVGLISQSQQVRINAGAEWHSNIARYLQTANAEMGAITLWDHPTNDVWCRDHGPIFLKQQESGQVALSDWKFNAWGGKFEPYDLDDEIPRQIEASLGYPRFCFEQILEGGAIESNGAGVLMTTEAVLLNENRSERATRSIWAAVFADAFAIDEVVWLADGVDHDDTDGHIDNAARFFAEQGVLVAHDSKHAGLNANFEQLKERFEQVIALPCPEVRSLAGEPLPASYANFLITNSLVLVPTFGLPQVDDYALGVIGDVFPKRKVCPVDCRILLEEGGAIHCLSMQQPL